jgi:hypothetical protein
MIFSYGFFLEQMAKHVLECFGMSNIWNIQLRDKWVPNSFEQNWKDQLQKLCLSENEESPKVLNYRIFKTEIKLSYNYESTQPKNDSGCVLSDDPLKQSTGTLLL